MVALSADRNTTQRSGASEQQYEFPVAAGAKIYSGAMVVLNTAGYAEPGTAAIDKMAVGRAERLADNSTGSAGAIKVQVHSGTFKWDKSGTIDRTHIGSTLYLHDDHTVRTSPTSTSPAGTCVDVDSDGLPWVATSLPELASAGSVGTAAKVTMGNMTIPIDYNLVSAVDAPAGTVFASQADVDAFLAAAGTTAFKHLQLAYNALPDVIAQPHTVTFQCAAGVHRPWSSQPGLGAWQLDSKQVLGNIVVQGALPSLYTPFSGIATAISVTASQAANRDPFVDVSGTPFATSAWAASTAYAVGDRRWNGAALGGTSGAAASIVTTGAATPFGQVRLTGLTGMTQASVGHNITISGAASAGNNGTFPITNFVSATSVDILNTAAVVPDASNGAISWAGSWVGTAASIVAGAAANRMRLTGLTGLTVSAVGHYLTITGAASAANNGTWQIVNFISATSCDVVNASAVIPDASNGAIAWTEKAGNTYRARITGTSAGSGGPTGTALTDIVDGTVTWRFLQVGPAVLKGSYAVFNTGQAAVIHDHTENRLNCMDVISPIPTSISFVGRQSTIFRNSLDDITSFKTNVFYNSCNAARLAVFSTSLYAKIKMQDCAVDPFGMVNNGTQENGAIQLFSCGAEFVRFMLDQDSAIDFPFNRTPAAGGIAVNDGSLSSIKMISSVHLTRAQAGPMNVMLGDASAELIANYFTGANRGIQINSQGHFGLVSVGNVFDSCGSNAGTLTFDHSKQGFLQDVGTAGLNGGGKENEFRNGKVGATPLVVAHLGDLLGEAAAQCRAVFKNNLATSCLDIRLGGDVRISAANANGLLDGGGNAGVGISMTGPASRGFLNTTTTVTGILGNISMGGLIYTYAQITSAGGIVDLALGNLLRR